MVFGKYKIAEARSTFSMTCIVTYFRRLYMIYHLEIEHNQLDRHIYVYPLHLYRSDHTLASPDLNIHSHLLKKNDIIV